LARIFSAVLERGDDPLRSINLFPNVKAGDGRSFMSKEKMLDCSWEEFEEMVRKVVGSGFTWKIRPRDTEGNRQAVMESVERLLRENNGTFPKEWNMFIEPEKEKPVCPEGETS
jgi:hypothetical protein